MSADVVAGSSLTDAPRGIPAEKARLGNHTCKEPANLDGATPQARATLGGPISSVSGDRDPVLGFLLLTIGVGQLRDKVPLVRALCPCLGNLGAYRARRSPDLPREGVGLLLGEGCGQPEDLQGERPSFLVDNQILKAVGVRQTAHPTPSLYLGPTTDHCPLITDHCSPYFSAKAGSACSNIASGGAPRAAPPRGREPGPAPGRGPGCRSRFRCEP